jgi:hypothetical protein
VSAFTLAIDPGLTNPAAALLRDGVLMVAERVKLEKSWAKLDTLDRCQHIASAILEWTSHQVVGCGSIGWGGNHLDTLIVEWPSWYRETKANGVDPNDLAGLCGIAGAIAGGLDQLRKALSQTTLRILSPTPREVWGQLPKSTKGDPWDSPRGRRLASRLTPAERSVIQAKHDALDAAGLGLFAAGRWQASRKVLPGAV